MFVLLASVHAGAGSALYKSVDQQGRVTYSDAPQPGSVVEAVEMPPPDTNTMSSESVAPLIEEQEKADREARAREQVQHSDWSARYQQARSDVDQAERALDDARQLSEGDLVGSYLGGTRPNSEWVMRLEQAEADLALKKENLRLISRQR